MVTKKSAPSPEVPKVVTGKIFKVGDETVAVISSDDDEVIVIKSNGHRETWSKDYFDEATGGGEGEDGESAMVGGLKYIKLHEEDQVHSANQIEKTVFWIVEGQDTVYAVSKTQWDLWVKGEGEPDQSLPDITPPPVEPVQPLPPVTPDNSLPPEQPVVDNTLPPEQPVAPDQQPVEVPEPERYPTDDGSKTE